MRYTLVVAVTLAAACSKKSDDARRQVDGPIERTVAQRFERQGGLELVLRETKLDTACARAGPPVSPVEEVIRRRFDAFGMTPDIRRDASGQLIVHVVGEGARDLETVKRIVAPGGCLTFREVDDVADPFAAAQVAEIIEKQNATAGAQERVERFTGRQRARLRSKSKAALERVIADLRDRHALPADHVIGYELDAKEGTHATLLLRAQAPLTGADVVEAKTTFDQMNGPVLSVKLSAAGAATFASLTRENIGRRLAICVDDRVYSAPVVKEAITGGQLQITMGSASTKTTLVQTRALAARLESAPLAAELLRTTTVPPAKTR